MKRHTAQEPKIADDARLIRAWRAWHCEQLAEALAGPHGAQLSELMTLLNRLEPSSAAPLLAFIRRSDWSSVNYDTRLTVLHQINDRITRMRERHGLAPFDDPLPGQPDNVFRIVRAILTPSPAHEHGSPLLRWPPQSVSAATSQRPFKRKSENDERERRRSE
jgi:hypothetical protein